MKSRLVTGLLLLLPVMLFLIIRWMAPIDISVDKINGSSVNAYNDSLVFEKLSQELRRHPLSGQFTIRWLNQYKNGTQSEFRVEYNRRKGTFTPYMPAARFYCDRVTDERIYKAAQNDLNVDGFYRGSGCHCEIAGM